MSWTNEQVAALADLPTVAVVLATYGFLVLETSVLIGLVVPGDLAVLIAAGLMPSWQAALLLVVAALAGSLTGELLGYCLGRAAGPALRRCWIGRRMRAERWQRAEAFLSGRGARALVPLRFVAVVQALAPVVAGTVRMPFGRYLRWSALGSAIWAATYVAVGALAGTSLSHLDWSLRLGLVAVLAVAVGSLLGGRVLRRQRNAPGGFGGGLSDLDEQRGAASPRRAASPQDAVTPCGTGPLRETGRPPGTLGPSGPDGMLSGLDSQCAVGVSCGGSGGERRQPANGAQMLDGHPGGAPDGGISAWVAQLRTRRPKEHGYGIAPAVRILGPADLVAHLRRSSRLAAHRQVVWET